MRERRTMSGYADQVIVDGYMAKDGSNLANARNIKLADGRKLFAGSTDDGSPQK